MAGRYWTTCPGCWLELPASGAPADPRAGASAECLRLYDEICACEPTARLRPLIADAYAAQHAGPEVPPLATAFALVGLHLALDRGFTGAEVRDAHRRMARHDREWPALAAPAHRGDLTVFDVAEAACAAEHADCVVAWAHAVWTAWACQHPAVASLAELCAPARGRLRAVRQGP